METKTIYKKLLECQKELGVVSKDKVNPFFKSNYADINNYLEVVKPVLSKHNLILLQPLETTESGCNILTTKIIDTESGEKVESNVKLPENPDPQKMGSAITYFRRFAIQSLLALQAADDDAQGTQREAQGVQRAQVGQQVKPRNNVIDYKKITNLKEPATDAQKKLIHKLLSDMKMDSQEFENTIGKEIKSLMKGEASSIIERGIEKQQQQGSGPIDDGEIPIVKEE